MTRFGVLVALLALTASAENVLRGRSPIDSPLRAITDGVVGVEGSGWSSPEAAQTTQNKGVTWDLGARVEVDKVAVQADNNEEWVLSASDDGKAFHELWRGPAVDAPGLQTRSASIDGAGRYFRLTGEKGDGKQGVAELELFRKGALRGESRLLWWWWLPRHPLDLAWLTWVMAVGLVLFATSSRVRRIWVLLALAALGIGLARMVPDTFYGAPIPARINWLRAMVALAASLAVLRELCDWREWPASRLATGAVLAVTSVLAVLCFANLGHPQFTDAGKGQATWLHHYDLRTYYPIAKYFKELRFTGVYAASALAVAEDRGGIDAIGGTVVRDLRTHETTDVKRQADLIKETRARFTPERWAEFRADAAYFRKAMGDGGWLGSMSDHGGNATPVWFLAAKLLFGSSPASDAVMWRSVIADGLLLLLAFAALGVAFGRRTMLIALVLFGAQDFYQFGSNWLGAPLRHDWLSLWIIGVCLLKLRWFKLAGAVLAWSAMIRAFPALTFVVMLAPALFGFIRARREHTSLRRWAYQQRALVHTLFGAALAVAVLFTASSIAFGPQMWIDWIHKVSMLDRDSHLNNLAFRTYVAPWPAIWVPVALLSTAWVMFTARRARLETAAAMGVMLVPMVFNSANYYLHIVCMLAVLAEEDSAFVKKLGHGIWWVLLMMCVASWPTSLPKEMAWHFGADTGVLLISLLVVLILLMVRAHREGTKAIPLPDGGEGARRAGEVSTANPAGSSTPSSPAEITPPA
ncbi:MAG: discoidin domain-containing protein [Myxococcaceae bacterium]